MACFKQSGLEQYLEESEPSPHRRMVESSLTSCSRCRTNFRRALATHARVNAWLGGLAAANRSIEVDSSGALTQVLARTEASTMFRIPALRGI